jgi:uncharacterized protein (TIGR03435 family)
MYPKRLLQIQFLTCLTLGVVQAQPGLPDGPRFEVVSIRTRPANAPITHRTQNFTPVLPGGQYVNSNVSPEELISFAYGVENRQKRLEGLPKWAKEKYFAVAAKPAPGFPALSPASNIDHVRIMMRAMLGERFGVRLHTETREDLLFGMNVAPAGLKLKEVDPPVPPETEGLVNMVLGNRSGRIIASKVTLANLARILSFWAGRTVINQTGLGGYYDLDLKWSEPDGAGEQDSSPLGPDGAALLLSTLRSQCGLRFTNTRGPLTYWIVDDVREPAEN